MVELRGQSQSPDQNIVKNNASDTMRKDDSRKRDASLLLTNSENGHSKRPRQSIDNPSNLSVICGGHSASGSGGQNFRCDGHSNRNNDQAYCADNINSKNTTISPENVFSGSSAMEEGQEVELSTHLQSMTMECDENNFNSNSYKNGNTTYNNNSSNRKCAEGTTPLSSNSDIELNTGCCPPIWPISFGSNDDDSAPESIDHLESY